MKFGQSVGIVLMLVPIVVGVIEYLTSMSNMLVLISLIVIFAIGGALVISNSE